MRLKDPATWHSGGSGGLYFLQGQGEAVKAVPNQLRENMSFLNQKARDPVLETLGLDPNFPHCFWDISFPKEF